MDIKEEHEIMVTPAGFETEDFINADLLSDEPFTLIGCRDNYNVDQFNNLIAAMQKAVEKYEEVK